jgi:hypothetical protein
MHFTQPVDMLIIDELFVELRIDGFSGIPGGWDTQHVSNRGMQG